MGFADERLADLIEDKKLQQLELAEKMVRKDWPDFFHKLEDDAAILNFAKGRAILIDKLEAISNFHGDEHAKSCIENGTAESVYAEQKSLFEVFSKAEVLSAESRKNALLKIDDKVIELINCLPLKSLNTYLLIVHNEGPEKAEEVRNSGDLRTYQTDYLRVYKPDARDSEISRPKFSEVINGAAGRAA